MSVRMRFFGWRHAQAYCMYIHGCTLTWSNETVRDYTTVFLPIHSDQRQVYGEYHQKHRQQNGLQLSKVDRTEDDRRYRFTDVANRLYGVADGTTQIARYKVYVDRGEQLLNGRQIK